MRITNRIITNNSLTNINRVKVTQDQLNTMMATGKKITKPSDDPVVAIRALRLRTESTKIDQYYDRNTEDAEAWMKVTDTSLDTVSNVLMDMLEKVGKGSSDTMATSERQTLANYIKSLAAEIYDSGDADYAGRYIFSGYRTDVPLTFKEDTTLKYSITEQLDKSALQTMDHVYTDDLLNYTKETYASLNAGELDIETEKVHRIQLAYKNTDATESLELSYYDAATGTQNTVTVPPMSLSTVSDPYHGLAATDVRYIPETGELLLGDDLYNALMDTRDDTTTVGVDESEIQINYVKKEWTAGELRPEHYFACTTEDAAGKIVNYNPEYLTGGGRQVIEYATGTGQSIQINTFADECFNHDIGRLAEDLASATETLASLDAIVDSLDKLLEADTMSASDRTIAEDKLAAAKKAQTFQRDKVQQMFDAAKTTVQGFIDRTSLASTNCGSRESRLALIQNRLSDQQLTMDNLVSENEDCDETEVAIELAGAKLAYDAALMATSKITQTTLLNYL